MGCTNSKSLIHQLDLYKYESNSYKDNISLNSINPIISKLSDIDEDGNTALMLACKYYEKTNIALEILEYPNQCELGNINKNGDTALMVAIKCKMENVALKILEYPFQCKKDHINKQGFTVLMLACRYNMRDVALELLKYPDTVI